MIILLQFLADIGNFLLIGFQDIQTLLNGFFPVKRNQVNPTEIEKRVSGWCSLKENEMPDIGKVKSGKFFFEPSADSGLFQGGGWQRSGL